MKNPFHSARKNGWAKPTKGLPPTMELGVLGSGTLADVADNGMAHVRFASFDEVVNSGLAYLLDVCTDESNAEFASLGAARKLYNTPGRVEQHEIPVERVGYWQPEMMVTPDCVATAVYERICDYIPAGTELPAEGVAMPISLVQSLASEMIATHHVKGVMAADVVASMEKAGYIEARDMHEETVYHFMM